MESNYKWFTGPMEYSKSLNELKGILLAIFSDGLSIAEAEELRFWLESNYELRHKPPFDEIFISLQIALMDGMLSAEEIQDIIWACGSLDEDSPYYKAITADMQFLHGIIHGILADNVISDTEIAMLKKWLLDNEDLASYYPYDEILTIIIEITQDGVIDDEERKYLKAFLSQFVKVEESFNLMADELEELKKSLKVSGIFASFPNIDFTGKKFCLTGESEIATKMEFEEKVNQLNGRYSKTVTRDLDYLVVGSKGNKAWAFSCYGRKIEQVMNLRKNGSTIQIIQEVDFWDAFEDAIAGIE